MRVHMTTIASVSRLRSGSEISSTPPTSREKYLRGKGTRVSTRTARFEPKRGAEMAGSQASEERQLFNMTNVTAAKRDNDSTGGGQGRAGLSFRTRISPA